MTQYQSQRAKQNRRKLARATAAYFDKLDEKAVKEENQLAHDFSLCARKAKTISARENGRSHPIHATD